MIDSRPLSMSVAAIETGTATGFTDRAIILICSFNSDITVQYGDLSETTRDTLFRSEH